MYFNKYVYVYVYIYVSICIFINLFKYNNQYNKILYFSLKNVYLVFLHVHRVLITFFKKYIICSLRLS